MAIGDAMSQTVPAVGTAGTGYASTLVSFLNEVKARLIAKVPLSSLLVGTLDMVNNAITNLGYATLYEQTDVPATGSIYMDGGNFWFVNASGAVQITDGTVLNTASVGAITGDYGGADPSRFKFVGADQEFYAYDDEAGGDWARVWARNFDIAGGAASLSRLRLAWTAGTSYTLTFPSAVPVAQTMMQMDTAGTVVLSNTIVGGLTLTTGDLDVTDGDITLTGENRVKHGDRTISDLVALRCVLGAAGVSFTNGPQPMALVTAAQQINIHLPNVGSTAQVTTVKLTGTGAAGSTPCTVTIDRHGSDSSLANQPITGVVSGAITSDFEYTFTLDTPLVPGEGACLVLRYTPAGDNAYLKTVTMVYDESV